MNETSAKTITLSLVSHTNVGKTTLARTLLRRDVGEVLDQAHTTGESQHYELVRAGDTRLVLWDTPGFGDSRRLLTRLQRESRPLVWFLQQTWDRFTDRPLWCSQQAMRTIREDTDLVLYLVNATEEPSEAGYVAPELDLLGWTGRPVLILLNQTGNHGFTPATIAQRLEAWRSHTDRWEAVRAVVHLDAFNRCWVQERVLFDHVHDALDIAERPAMARLRDAWDVRNLEVFGSAVDHLADYLATAARAREVFVEKRPSRADKKQAMEALAGRLVRETETLMSLLLTAYGLEGVPGADVEKAIDAFVVKGEERIDPERGALLGGVVSGALSGLAADVMSGGLSLGGGLIAGAILGALGGMGLARGYQLARGDKRPEVRWSPAFLDRLAEQTLLRYWAVAHFGRGRGPFETLEHPERWRDAVSGRLRDQADDWRQAWSRAAHAQTTPKRLRRLVDETLRSLLVDAYPKAAPLLGARSKLDSADFDDPRAGDQVV